MSLQFIYGVPGSGKTGRCIKEITELAEGAPPEREAALVYIVPEQFTLESEKSLCAASRSGAVLTPQVLSFQRLAYRLFAETGQPTGVLLDDAGKAMLLRKIVTELKGELPYFKKSAEKQGFIDNALHTLREFHQYGVTPESLDQAIVALSGEKENAAAEKFKDLATLYVWYNAAIRERYFVTDKLLDYAPDKVAQSSFLNGARVWIDGFTGFTPQELHIIERLLVTCEKVTVSLLMEAPGAPKSLYMDPFRETKQTAVRLSELADEHRVNIEPNVILAENLRHGAVPALKHLSRHYFAAKPAAFSGDASRCLEIRQSKNPAAEADDTAQAILCLVREGGLRYRDIAVVPADPETTRRAIEHVWPAYDIPWFSDDKTDILSHPLTELARGAAAIVAENWSYEAVFRFLKTRMTSLPQKDIDVLENYVLAHGIKGDKWRDAEWTYGFAGGAFDADTIHRIKAAVLAAAAPFTGRKTRHAKLKLRVFAEDMYKLFDALSVHDTLTRWAAEAAKNGDHHAAAAHSQMLGKLNGIFDKMVEILGDEPVTVSVFREILDAGLKATDMGRIPPSLDHVIVGDVTRSRFPAVKALFILGAADGALPSVQKDDGMLTDDERAALRKHGVELAPDTRQKSAGEQLLIYAALTQPSEKLIVSYAAGSLSGKATRPSPVIGKLLKLFPGLKIRKEAPEGVSLPKPMLEDMGAVLAKMAAGDPVSKTEAACLNWLKKDPRFAARVSAMETLRFEKPSDMLLGDIAVKKLYGANILTGVSRLEQYMRCPFAYFVEHNLKARPRKLYEATPIDYGNFFHSVLQLFSETLKAEGEAWQHLTAEKIAKIVDHCMEALVPALSNDVLLSTARFRHMLGRVGGISKSSLWALAKHVASGLFVPKGFEVAFGEVNGLPGIAVNLDDGRRLTLTGRIDRVDTAEIDGETYVKIIDYKSGNTKFDLSALLDGTQLQLMVYLDAYINAASRPGGKLLPGGMFYFNIQDPILPADGDITPEAHLAALFKCYKMSGLLLKDEKVVRAMDADVSGHSAIMPVYLTENGIGAASSAVDENAFDALRALAVSKLKDIGKQMVSGRIGAKPYKAASGETGCDFCGYKAVCRAEAQAGGMKYRSVEKKKLGDVISDEQKNE